MLHIIGIVILVWVLCKVFGKNECDCSCSSDYDFSEYDYFSNTHNDDLYKDNY
jgi:hypothetical protein